MVGYNNKVCKGQDMSVPLGGLDRPRNGALTSTAKLTGLREFCSIGKFRWIETSNVRLNSTPTLKMRTGIEKG